MGSGGLNSERGGKKPFWASGEARGAIKRGRVGPEPGCSRVLTVVTRRLMRPTRRGPRVGRLSSRKPVKSMPKIYERPAASWIRELPTDPVADPSVLCAEPRSHTSLHRKVLLRFLTGDR